MMISLISWRSFTGIIRIFWKVNKGRVDLLFFTLPLAYTFDVTAEIRLPTRHNKDEIKE